MAWLSQHSMLLGLVNVLIPLACLIFATGFFPYKPFIPGFAKYERLSLSQTPEAHFDKIIFMVIDALRSDFVFSNQSGFDFVQSLVSNGAAIPFTAHASAPTVTMPRIKALTTGSIPSFVDMILNVAESDTSSSLVTQDTWLAQMLLRPAGKAVMYGDDTWLKLFPETFARADGTSSFFVADFIEVDRNVTRHVPEELNQSDWNTMVMHYLGVDHIGHKAGPRSHNMIPKQREMDAIVRQIYEALETIDHHKSTLLVLAGDHGMNDAGNHGGSAPGETSAAMVFMSPKFKRISTGLPCPTEATEDFTYYDRVQQSDLAPTLAALLGFPIPLNNLGIILSKVLPMWDSEKDQIELLKRNAMQLLAIVKARYTHPVFEDPAHSIYCDGILTQEEDLACAWRTAVATLQSTSDPHKFGETKSALYKFCDMAQDTLSSSASDYNVFRLWIGIMTGAISVLVAFTYCMVWHRSQFTVAGVFCALSTLSFTAMMFASSFVEEEQQFWYWITSAWVSILLVRRSATNWRFVIPILVLLRISARWNQSGQKHQGALDISKALQEDGLLGKPLLWILISITYLIFAQNLYRDSLWSSGFSKTTSLGISTLITATSGLFRIQFAASNTPELLGGKIYLVKQYTNIFPSLTVLARISFSLLGFISVFILRQQRRRISQICSQSLIYPILLQLLVLQVRTTSIPLLLVLHFTIYAISHLDMHGCGLAFMCVSIAKCAYFSLGGTNAISSLDLSLSYNGVSTYDPIAVGILLVVSNFGTAIMSSVAIMLGARRLNTANEGFKKNGKTSQQEESAGLTRRGTVQKYRHQSNSSRELDLVSLWIAIEGFAVMAACAWLREHLFVWTVFSPRFLYQAAWVITWHLFGNIGLATLSYRLS